MTEAEALAAALKAFRSGDARLCLERLGPLLQTKPAPAAALLLAAQAAAKLDDKKAGADYYRRAADAMPSRRAAFLSMAEALEPRSSAPDDAVALERLEDVVEALVIAPRLLSAVETAAIDAHKRRDHAGALARFDEAAAAGRLDDVSPALLAVLALSARETGDVERAIHYLWISAEQNSAYRAAFLREAVTLARTLYDERAVITEAGYAAARALVALEPCNRFAAIFYRLAMHFTGALEDQRSYHVAAEAGLRAGDDFFRTTEIVHNHILWCADEALNASIDPSLSVTPFSPEMRARRRARSHVFGERIRVAYLTSDLYAGHPTSLLFKGVLAAHDRERFDIAVYCNTPAPFSEQDLAFRATLPGLTEIGHFSVEDAHQLIRARGTDILVDLKGPTANAWSDLVNSGPAPIQVAWLGFPGSAFGVDCDYIISDPVVTPDESKPHYLEKFCRLPETYQCNDCFGRPLVETPSRGAVEEGAFLFSSFNSLHKLSPQIIDLWAKILAAVPTGRLVLLGASPLQERNFLNAMARKGLSSDRFQFWPRVAYPDHLARIPLTDLGLDCYPCNGHTTTSDMLWAGLPVATFRGSHFASRVSESLLKAIGLPELVAEDADGFVALAVALARDPARLAQLRQRIADNRFRAPLFDTERFTRHLERGFAMMVERAQNGLAPDHFDVPALAPRKQPFR